MRTTSKMTTQESALFYADESSANYSEVNPTSTGNNNPLLPSARIRQNSKVVDSFASTPAQDSPLPSNLNSEIPPSGKPPQQPNSINKHINDSEQNNNNQQQLFHKQANRTNRGIEARIRAAAGTSLPVANPPVFTSNSVRQSLGGGDGGRPATSQLQRVFALIEEKVGVVGSSNSKEKLDALLKAFAEDKEQSRTEAEKFLTEFRIQRAIAKEETEEAEKLSCIAMNALARCLNESLAVTEAAAVNSLTVGKESILRSGLSTCARGLLMPYEFFTKAMEYGNTSIDSTYEHWVERGHARVSLAADEAAARGVAHTTASLSDLERSFDTKNIFSPRQLAMFRGAREDCEIALRAAVVWRMLHQVQATIGGMRVATTAFEQLLPAMFGGIVVNELPHMSSIGGQVLQLLKFPTLKTNISSLRMSAEHLRQDADYFRKAMQHWAIQLWFRQLVAEKRKTRVLDRVGDGFDRLTHRDAKRKAFSAWKMLATRGRIARFVLRTSHELNEAMNQNRITEDSTTSGNYMNTIEQEAYQIQQQQQQNIQQRIGGGGQQLSSSSSNNNNNNASAASATLSRRRELIINDMSCLQSSEPWTLLGETALDAVKTLTVVTSAFRVQIARQREHIERAEAEREHLRDKVSLLESKLLRQIEATNRKNNEVERLKQELYESRCGHNNAKSRLMQQEHIPWREQAMDFVREIAVLPPLRPVSDEMLYKMMMLNNNNNSLNLLSASANVNTTTNNAKNTKKDVSTNNNNNNNKDGNTALSLVNGRTASATSIAHLKQHDASASSITTTTSPPKRLGVASASARWSKDDAETVSNRSFLSASANTARPLGASGRAQKNANDKLQSFVSTTSSANSANNKQNTSSSSATPTKPSASPLKKGTTVTSPQQLGIDSNDNDTRRPSTTYSTASSATDNNNNNNNNATVAGTNTAYDDSMRNPTLTSLSSTDAAASIKSLLYSSPIQLDEPEDILMRWANTCLADLQNLENGSESPMALLRCSNAFSWEWSDCLLFSRLLYFLALPKFIARQQRNNHQQQRNRKKKHRHNNDGGGAEKKPHNGENHNSDESDLDDGNSDEGDDEDADNKNDTDSDSGDDDDDDDDDDQNSDDNTVMHGASTRRDNHSTFGTEMNSVFAATYKGGAATTRRSAHNNSNMNDARSTRMGNTASEFHARSVIARSRMGGGAFGAGGGGGGGGGGATSVFSRALSAARMSAGQQSGGGGGMGGANTTISMFLMPSTKNTQAVMDYSAGCRAMLLEGDAMIEIIDLNNNNSQINDRTTTKNDENDGHTSADATQNNNNNNSNIPKDLSTNEPTFLTNSTTASKNNNKANPRNENARKNKSFSYLISPAYSECFHDFHVVTARQKCEIVCAFARELLDLGSGSGNDNNTSVNIPVAVESDLLSGQRSAIILLVGLLYMKFAHPLSHGRKQGMEPIPSDVIISTSNNNNNNNNAGAATSPAPVTTDSNNHDSNANTVRNPYAKVEEPGVPVSRTELLAGGLWTVTCVDNPRVLREVCSWASLMRHSLDEHRWHICREILFVDSIVARDVRTRSLAALRRSVLDVLIPRRHADLFSLQHKSTTVWQSRKSSRAFNGNNNILNTFMTNNTDNNDSIFFDRCKESFSGVIDSLRNPAADEFTAQVQQELQFQEQLKILNQINNSSNASKSNNKSASPTSTTANPLHSLLRGVKNRGGATDTIATNTVTANSNNNNNNNNNVQDTMNPLNSFRATDDFELPAMYSSKKNTLESVESNAIYGEQQPTQLKLHQQQQQQLSNTVNTVLRPKNNTPLTTFDMLFANTSVRVDVLAQLQSSLAALHDLYIRRSTTEWDSGAIKGLKQATLIDIMVESEVVIIAAGNNTSNLGVLSSKSEFQNIILAEKQYREQLKIASKQNNNLMNNNAENSRFTTVNANNNAKGESQKNLNLKPSTNNFLTVDKSSGAFVSVAPSHVKKEDSAVGMLLGIPRTTSDLDEKDVVANNTDATHSSHQHQQQPPQPQQFLHANAPTITAAANSAFRGGDGEEMKRFGGVGGISSSTISMRGDYAKFVTFEEFIGIIARLVQIEILNNKTNSFLPAPKNGGNQYEARSFAATFFNKNSNSFESAPNNNILDPLDVALVTLTSYKSIAIQRLTNFSDSTETSRFKDMLETLAVSERFSAFKGHLQEVFESCATTNDGTPFTQAKERYDSLHQAHLMQLQQAQLRQDNSGNLLSASNNTGRTGANLNASLRSGYQAPTPPLPFITFETFNKLVQESSLAVSHELTRHVFDEAMRMSNFKRHASRSNNSLGSSFSNNNNAAANSGKGNKSSPTRSGSSNGTTNSLASPTSASHNNMLNMKFTAFVKAVALLAYAYDPLPTLPFEERLAKFVPQFCDSIRPVVLAMTRAKNVEIEKKVNIKASENRMMISASPRPNSPSSKNSPPPALGATTSSQKSATQQGDAKNDGNNQNATLGARSALKRPTTSSDAMKNASETTAGSKGLRNFLNGSKK